MERASRKRTASQAKQDSADVGQGEQVPDIDMEGSAQPEAAEDTEAAPPGRKRRKKAEPAATAAASKGSQKQARKKPVRKVSRTAAQERESTAEPEASTSHAAPAQAPAHTSRGRKRKAASVSTAAAGRALSVPSTPRQPTSTRLSAADALLSPTRERQEPVILLSSCASTVSTVPCYTAVLCSCPVLCMPLHFRFVAGHVWREMLISDDMDYAAQLPNSPTPTW